MLTAIETILRRRSVRRFTPQQISDEDLKTILDCALYAPTGHNLQYPRFLVIQDPERMAALNEVIRSELLSCEAAPGTPLYAGAQRAGREGYHFCYRAPTLITAVAPRMHANSMADCACALENIQLAATTLGLGACWSNQAHWLTDAPRVREIFEDLGMREDEDIFGSVTVGVPDGEAAAAPARRPGRVLLDRPRSL